MNKEKLLFFWRYNKILILIVVGSFSASLVYSFYFHVAPAVDARAYDIIAQNIVSGVGFREEPQKDILHDQAIVRVGPLYQYFLAGIYAIFGHHYEPVWVSQALLRGLTVWLIYLTALLMFAGDDKKKKIGLWAAAIIGFYPDLIEISAMILSETLYIFLVCLLIYIFFSYFYKNEIRQLIVLGFLAGLATLARPPVLLFVPIIFFHFYKKKQLWRAVIFLLILIAVFLPWTVRNYMIYDKIMPFGVAGAFNFWIGNYHGGNGEQESKQEQYDFMASHETKEIPGESMRQFKAFLLNYPTEFIKLTFLRVNKYFSVIRPMGFWFYQTGISQLLFILSSAAASILLFVLGLAGFIKALKIKNSAVYYLMTFLILTPLIIFITVVETRYRFQIYPLLALLAGFFIMKSGSIKKWLLNDKIFLAALTIIMANGLLDLFLSFEKFKWRLGQFF